MTETGRVLLAWRAHRLSIGAVWTQRNRIGDESRLRADLFPIRLRVTFLSARSW
jgi:hypothetical protein